MPSTIDNVIELAPHQTANAGTRLFLNRLQEVLGLTSEAFLAARFEHDDCSHCGHGASRHQVRLDRYDSPIVECVDRFGDVRC